MKLIYFVIAAALLISVKSYAQTGRDVHGSLTDSTKQTLPGSTVKLVTATDSVTTITDCERRICFSGGKGNSVQFW